MCERYALPDQATAEREFMPGRTWWKFSPKFNVAAHQYVPAIRWHDNESEAMMMRWGLIPSWAEGKPIDVPPVSVEVDEILKSQMHRAPWLNSQRCILPIAGFYAWQLTDARHRQPYFVRLLDRSVFGLAAVWDRSVSEEDDVVESCSVISVPANELMASIANTEFMMPAILRRRDYQCWLQGTPAEAMATLRTYKPGSMQAYAVSPRINSTVPDDPGLILPVH
jgi:putative SOS response-associated peptidase YedK